jgi:hypothetical protein
MGHRGPVLSLWTSGPEGLEPKYHSFILVCTKIQTGLSSWSNVKVGENMNTSSRRQKKLYVTLMSAEYLVAKCVYEYATRYNDNFLVSLQDLYTFRVPVVPIIRSTILQLTVTDYSRFSKHAVFYVPCNSVNNRYLSVHNSQGGICNWRMECFLWSTFFSTPLFKCRDGTSN